MTKILNVTQKRGGLWSPGISGIDPYEFPVPPGESYFGSRLTIISGDQQAQATIASQPSPGQTGTLGLKVQWECSLLGMVQYQIEAFSAGSPPSGPGANPPSPTRQMTGFLPSVNGFHFDNQFPSVPLHVIQTVLGDINIGDASNGLCGGMVYTALDYFNAGLGIPPDPNPPSNGALFDYIVNRLVDSFNLPGGVMKYIELMNPSFPSGQMQFGIPGLVGEGGRAWVMIREEWPVIKMKLDACQACPLGLIKVISGDLGRLGQNHQVLAYGYDQTGNDLTLFIADPNFHNDDTISLKLSLADPTQATPVTYSTGEAVYCFFHTNYAFSVPPGAASVPGRLLLFAEKNFNGQLASIVGANPDLSTYRNEGFSQPGSSFTILGGNWSFYQNPQFASPILHGAGPIVLGPGAYADAQSIGIDPGQLLSLKSVVAPPNPQPI